MIYISESPKNQELIEKFLESNNFKYFKGVKTLKSVRANFTEEESELISIICGAIGAKLSLHPSWINTKKRDRIYPYARKLYCYLTYKMLPKKSQRELSTVINVDRSTLSVFCTEIIDRLHEKVANIPENRALASDLAEIEKMIKFAQYGENTTKAVIG